MTTSYPRSLSSYVQRISNYSRNTFKLTPYRTDGITPSQVVVVDLPSNALCDLETFTFHFTATTTPAATHFGVFPKNIESILQKVVVEVNGVTLGSCSNLGYVYSMLLQYQQGTDLKNKRALYQKSGGVTEEPAAQENAVPYKIHNWLGFIGSCKPEVLDTSLTGNVRCHIYLEDANCLVVDADTTVASYTLDSCYFTIDTISIDDSIYYNLHNEYLLSGGIYSYPFTSIYTALFSVASQTQSARFSVNTQSLDMVMAGFFPNYGGGGAKSRLDTSTEVTNTSIQYKKRGTGITSWQYELNGISIPTFTAGLDDAYPLALNALNMSQDIMGGVDPDIATAASYIENYFVPVIRLCHNTDPDERYISGYNCNGSSCNLVFKTTGGALDAQLLVVAFCTSTMNVSAGRSVSVIS